MATLKIIRESPDLLQRYIPAKEPAMLCPKCGAEMTEQIEQYDNYDCPVCDKTFEIKEV